MQQLMNNHTKAVTLIITMLFIGSASLWSNSAKADTKPTDISNTESTDNTTIQDPNNYFMLSLEELSNIKVFAPSMKMELPLEAPGIVSVVSQKEIQLYGDQNLEQLMNRQTSVYTRITPFYSHNQASFRGDINSPIDQHTLLLINGRPLRNSRYGGDNISAYLTFPLSHLSNIEIIRGPGSVLFGTNAFTGVANLRSKPYTTKTKFQYNATGGSNGYWATSLSGTGMIGDIGFTSDFRGNGTRGFDTSMYDMTGNYNTDFDTNRSFSTMNHFVAGNLTLDLFYSNLETFYLGIIPIWNTTDNIHRHNTLFGNLGYKIEFDEQNILDLNLTLNKSNTDFDRPGYVHTTYNCEDWISEATFHSSPIDDLNIAIGGFIENQRKTSGDYDNDSIYPPYDLEPWGTYSQADYRLNDQIKVIGGLQRNHSSFGIADTVSRFGLILTPYEKWGIKLLRGEAFRAPHAIETTLDDPPILVGNKNLKPEKLTTYDAQLFYQDAKSYYTFTYFNTNIKDIIVSDNSVSPISFTNKGNFDYNGLEFEHKYFFTNNFHTQGSYTFFNSSQSQEIDPSTVPRHMLKFGSAYIWDLGSAALFYSFYSKPSTYTNTAQYNPDPDIVNMLSLNIRIDAAQFFNTPINNTTIVIKGDNLFDEEVWISTHRSGPNTQKQSDGATFYIGMEIEL